MDITKHDFKISKSDREKIKNQKSCTIWMSGLSGSGKSTIANLLETILNEQGYHTYTLDGDNTRLGLNKGLGLATTTSSFLHPEIARSIKLINKIWCLISFIFIT